MGIEDTARRRIGPATRALAAPARPPRRRLPTLQEAFEAEERSTDSEIANVLGVIESVRPMPPAPEAQALPPEREESGMQPRSEVPPSREDLAIFDDHPVALRKRQLMVVTAVCAFGALVLALVAVVRVIRGGVASERPSATQGLQQLAPAAAAADTPLSSPSDVPSPAAPTGVTARPPPAAPQSQTASHPPPSKRLYRPNSN
jgi:hypothetical protein